MCRELIQFVSGINDVALPRLVRGGIRIFNTTILTLRTSQAKPQIAFRHATVVQYVSHLESKNPKKR